MYFNRKIDKCCDACDAVEHIQHVSVVWVLFDHLSRSTNCLQWAFADEKNIHKISTNNRQVWWRRPSRISFTICWEDKANDVLHLKMYVLFVYSIQEESSKAMQLNLSRDKNCWHVFETIFFRFIRGTSVAVHSYIYIYVYIHEYPFVMMLVMSGNVNNLSSKYWQSNEVSSGGNFVFFLNYNNSLHVFRSILNLDMESLVNVHSPLDRCCFLYQIIELFAVYSYHDCCSVQAVAESYREKKPI